eukprot:scaffold20396_cov101-Isochrysis_galbana.AAC.3
MRFSTASLFVTPRSEPSPSAPACPGKDRCDATRREADCGVPACWREEGLISVAARLSGWRGSGEAVATAEAVAVREANEAAGFRVAAEPASPRATGTASALLLLPTATSRPPPLALSRPNARSLPVLPRRDAFATGASRCPGGRGGRDRAGHWVVSDRDAEAWPARPTTRSRPAQSAHSAWRKRLPASRPPLWASCRSGRHSGPGGRPAGPLNQGIWRRAPARARVTVGQAVEASKRTESRQAPSGREIRAPPRQSHCRGRCTQLSLQHLPWQPPPPWHDHRQQAARAPPGSRQPLPLFVPGTRAGARGPHESGRRRPQRPHWPGLGPQRPHRWPLPPRAQRAARALLCPPQPRGARLLQTLHVRTLAGDSFAHSPRFRTATFFVRWNAPAAGSRSLQRSYCMRSGHAEPPCVAVSRCRFTFHVYEI